MADNHDYIFSLKQKIYFKFKNFLTDNASFWPILTYSFGKISMIFLLLAELLRKIDILTRF
jgi:hypothetical protein